MKPMFYNYNGDSRGRHAYIAHQIRCDASVIRRMRVQIACP